MSVSVFRTEVLLPLHALFKLLYPMFEKWVIITTEGGFQVVIKLTWRASGARLCNGAQVVDEVSLGMPMPVSWMVRVLSSLLVIFSSFLLSKTDGSSSDLFEKWVIITTEGENHSG